LSEIILLVQAESITSEVEELISSRREVLQTLVGIL